MSIRSATEARRLDNTFTDRFTLSCLCALQLDLWSLYGNRIPPFLPLYRFYFQAQMLDTVASEIVKSFCAPHGRQGKKVLKSFQFYARRRSRRGPRYVEKHLWPLQLHTKLCLQLAPFQQFDQICWKLKFIISAVHRYLSEEIKAQCFLPSSLQLISFYIYTVLALSLSLCNILSETITVSEAESPKVLRFHLKQCFLRKREVVHSKGLTEHQN